MADPPQRIEALELRVATLLEVLSSEASNVALEIGQLRESIEKIATAFGWVKTGEFQDLPIEYYEAKRELSQVKLELAQLLRRDVEALARLKSDAFAHEVSRSAVGSKRKRSRPSSGAGLPSGSDPKPRKRRRQDSQGRSS